MPHKKHTVPTYTNTATANLKARLERYTLRHLSSFTGIGVHRLHTIRHKPDLATLLELLALDHAGVIVLVIVGNPK